MNAFIFPVKFVLLYLDVAWPRSSSWKFLITVHQIAQSLKKSRKKEILTSKNDTHLAKKSFGWFWQRIKKKTRYQIDLCLPRFNNWHVQLDCGTNIQGPRLRSSKKFFEKSDCNRWPPSWWWTIYRSRVTVTEVTPPGSCLSADLDGNTNSKAYHSLDRTLPLSLTE